MKQTKSEFGTNEYESDDGSYRAWFKFGCLHLDILQSDASPSHIKIKGGLYIHVCSPISLMEFLKESMKAEAKDPDSNSYDEFTALR